MDKKETEWEIKKYISFNDAKIYGDSFIGYRAQLPNGKYDDSGFHHVYELVGGLDDCEIFNEICESIKSGDHNW